MDMSYVTSTVANQQSSFQTSAATAVLKKSLDAESNAVLTILGAANPQANVGSGVGGNLDVSA